MIVMVFVCGVIVNVNCVGACDVLVHVMCWYMCGDCDPTVTEAP